MLHLNGFFSVSLLLLLVGDSARTWEEVGDGGGATIVCTVPTLLLQLLLGVIVSAVVFALAVVCMGTPPSLRLSLSLCR
uniref:Secreted protein n=1 Tax=Ixodes ricinus TaxID=34613 RepID=A0A6B0UCV1_IXORI